MRRVFVLFLEEIEDTKKPFRNYLTFRARIYCLLTLVLKSPPLCAMYTSSPPPIFRTSIGTEMFLVPPLENARRNSKPILISRSKSHPDCMATIFSTSGWQGRRNRRGPGGHCPPRFWQYQKQNLSLQKT